MLASRLVRLGSFTCLIAFLSISAHAENTETEPFDTRYISSDAAIVAVLHPQRMLAAKPRIPETTKSRVFGRHQFERESKCVQA